MSEYKDANTNDVLVEYIEMIADALCGENTEGSNGDRLRSALGRIAKRMEKDPIGIVMDNQADSTATTGSGAATDLNSLLVKLKDAGLMEKDALDVTVTKNVTDSIAGHSDRQDNTDKISSVAESDGVITITLSKKVSALKDFDGGNGWGVHKWLGIGVTAGVSPITGLYYNGSALTSADVDEATVCGLSAGYFVRWVAADLVLAGDNTQKSKGYFTLKAAGTEEKTYTLKIVEPA